jgi:LytS/YehU family sensor histidine kinase
MGWFPSKVIIKNLSGMTNDLQYNRDYLIKNMNFIEIVEIKFESKFDIELNIPDKLYHLSIKEFEKSILKNVLSPKSKSKISYHDSRIYVCKHVINCKSLASISSLVLQWKHH